MQTLGMYRILPLLGLCVLNICISVTLGQAACDPATEFRCTMDLPGSLPRCIQLQQVNNSVNDCLDNSDEVWRPCQKKDGFSCKNNRCVIMAWVLDGTDDCHDGSDEAKIVGTSCGMINTCCECDQYVAWTECRNATCQCVSGFYNNSLGTVCHRRIIGDWCDVNADCHDAFNNSHCENGFCVCDIGYYTSDDNASCVANRVGDVCEVDGNCTAVIHQSNCTNAQCMCNSGYYQSSDRTTCIKRTVGSNCESVLDCSAAVHYSTCGENSTCQCVLGYVPKENNTVCERLYLGEACISNEECQAVMDYSECMGGECACVLGYGPAGNNTECIKRPTLPPYVPWDPSPPAPSCNPNATKTGCEELPNTECIDKVVLDDESQDSNTGHCECISGYVRKSSLFHCVRAHGFVLYLRLAAIAGTWDILPLRYTTELMDPTSKDYRNLKDRIEGSGVSSIYQSTHNLTDLYITNKLVNLSDRQVEVGQPGVLAQVLLYFEKAAPPIQADDVYTVIHNAMNRSTLELGDSRLYVAEPWPRNVWITDLNECNENISLPLHDCDANAECVDLDVLYTCVCNIEYRDISDDKDNFPGRRCEERPAIVLTSSRQRASCSDDICETPWTLVIGVMTLLFTLLFALVVIEVIWRKRNMSARPRRQPVRIRSAYVHPGSAKRHPVKHVSFQPQHSEMSTDDLVSSSSSDDDDSSSYGVDNPAMEP